MIGITLDDRLMSAAKYVRQDAHLADIGTDHAYLPVFLLLEGRIRSAVLADINEGPLDSARRTVDSYGLGDRVEYRLTDGCLGISNMGITDYTICGMGGELIARIVEDAPELRSEHIRLILQPMSREGHLRRTLARLGFYIESEAYTYAGGKYYLTILAGYDGICRDISASDAELGASAEILGGDCYIGYLNKRRHSLVREREGRISGGLDCSEQDTLIRSIDERISKYGGD